MQTPGGLLEGHVQCAAFLEDDVKNLLLTDANLDLTAQSTLLEEISPCFPEADNAILESPPTLKSVQDTIKASNLHAAPRCDGIPSLLYKVCWDTIGPSLTGLMQDVFKSSLRTSLMVFGSIPKIPAVFPRTNAGYFLPVVILRLLVV